MLATVHIQLEVDLWQTHLRPQHQRQQCEWASGGGHAVQHVIHAVAYDYQLLHGCMGPVCECPAVAVCWAPPSHQWGQLPCLPHRTPEWGPWTGNWIVLSCCCQPTESSASFLVWQPSQPHVSLHPFHTWLLLCLSGSHPCKYPKRGPHVTHCAAEKRYMGWLPARHIHITRSHLATKHHNKRVFSIHLWPLPLELLGKDVQGLIKRYYWCLPSI